jgi:hypothetical protein
MRNFARVVLISGLVLVGSTSVFSQNNSPSKSDKKGGVATLKILYDKKADETTVFLLPATNVSQFDNKGLQRGFPNEGRDPRGISPELLGMKIYFKHKGKDLTVPNQIFVSFDIFTEDRLKYTSDREFAVKADDWQLNPGKMALTNKHRDTNLADVNGRQFSRLNLETPIEYADFLRILKAKNVQMRLGQTVFNLSGEYIESLKQTTDKISVESQTR